MKNNSFLLKKQEFIERVEKIGKDKLSILVTVSRLPTGAKEVIINYQELDKKVDYIIDAYNDNLELKTCTVIKILDFVVL
jgi:hypothetical protein